MKRLDSRWGMMLKRCTDVNAVNYPDYGGRGIYVCERWTIRNNYIEDIMNLPGYDLDKHLDRIDNDGPYSPDNCRWVEPKDNNRNRRNNIIIEVDGVKYCQQDFVERFTWLSPTGAQAYLNKGFSMEQLPMCPPGTKSKYFWSFRSGELRPKPPFHGREWLYSP